MAQPIQHYQDLGEFEYGATDQVTPMIRRVICKNPTPFTFKGTGTYIVGHGQVAVIDPGPPLESHLDDILGALEPDEEPDLTIQTALPRWTSVGDPPGVTGRVAVNDVASLCIPIEQLLEGLVT